MKDLSLHILDIVQNAITADARNITVTITEDTAANTYRIRIEDDGKGMSRDMVEKVTDPYYTSRTTRKVGLGIPLFKQNAEQTGGNLTIESTPGEGTTIEAVFVHDNIDRPAAGDIPGVVGMLIGGNPDIRFRYVHRKDDTDFVLDTREVSEALEGMPVSDPEIVRYLKEMIQENLQDMDAI
ncbi:MAG: ATP-binding protein [Bacteroidales bacterium]